MIVRIEILNDDGEYWFAQTHAVQQGTELISWRIVDNPFILSNGREFFGYDIRLITKYPENQLRVEILKARRKGEFQKMIGRLKTSIEKIKANQKDKKGGRIMIKLGDKVRDKLTGFCGTVTARTEWLNGCVRLGVQPIDLKDGIPKETVWIDEIQFEIVVETDVERKRMTGGPMPNPKRASDP